MSDESDDIDTEVSHSPDHCGLMAGREYEQAKEEIHDLFDDVREDLAEDLGGDPEDYRASRPKSDGGDE